jgi:hypothetical protein
MIGQLDLEQALREAAPDQVYQALRAAWPAEQRLEMLALLLHDHPAHDLGVHRHSHAGAVSGPMAEDPHDHLHTHQQFGVTHKHPHFHAGSEDPL